MNGNFRLIDLIRELDKRGRKQIEEKYRKIFKDGLETKSKIKKKKKALQKKREEDPNKYGAYFNYLPFEKAVIESRGKTPYNNREVEQIVYNPNILNNLTRAKSSNTNAGSGPIGQMMIMGES